MSSLLDVLGIVDESTEKVCTKCKTSLPLSYYSNSSGANYLRNECKPCNNKLGREREALKKKHPLSNPKDHVCPICKKTYVEVLGRGGKNHKSPWVIDHNHETGLYRDYLCHDCNRALGILSESETVLTNAIEYLKKHA
jgi:DNA-directed RNA polymerase subunit RPC12/RpoP